jgi:hypothetical protein
MVPRTKTGGQCCPSDNRNAGETMKCCNEIVPLALMGSLSAAIMVVFAVTMMH